MYYADRFAGSLILLSNVYVDNVFVELWSGGKASGESGVTIEMGAIYIYSEVI